MASYLSKNNSGFFPTGLALVVLCLILSCDQLNLIEITVDDAQGTQAEGVVRHQVELSAPSTDTVTVDYKTSDLSAKAETDYDSTEGTLVFEPGDAEQTVEVPILESTFDSPNKRYRIQLENPQGAIIVNQNRQAFGIIYKDSVNIPKVSVHDAEAVLGADSVEVLTSLSSPAKDTVTVDFKTADQSAAAGENFAASEGTVTFEPEETEQMIEIALLDSSFSEPLKKFMIRIDNPVGAELENQKQSAAVTIRNR